MSNFKIAKTLTLGLAVLFSWLAYGAGRPCANTKFSVYNDLIRQVNIVAQVDAAGNISRKDPRRAVSVVGPLLGMSKAEIVQAYTSHGDVVCPGGKNHNPAKSSATIVGAGGVIFTIAHAFIDENRVVREPLSACYFENKTSPPTRVPLKFVDGSYEFLTRAPSIDGANDFAFVALKHKIDGAVPYRIDNSGETLRRGQQLITISSSPERLEVPTVEPVAQACVVKQIFAATATGRAYVLNDCAATPGGSGSINLARDSGGELVIKALLRSGGPADQDYQPYKTTVPGAKDNSYGLSVAVDRVLNERLVEIQDKQNLKTVNNNPGEATKPTEL